MLIIQIALGIVLAAVILNYWRQIIGLGIDAIIIIAVFAGVYFGGSYTYENFDNALPFLVIIMFIATLYFLQRVIRLFNKRLTVRSIEKWDLSSEDIGSVLFSILLLMLAISLFGAALYWRDESTTFYVLGTIFFIASVMKGISSKKEIEKSREKRAIRRTYLE